ncbi:peroxiredoxin-like family protein [Kozakia baliensis]|uniref:peroxiredoxin-like family protein n=1 Tax=Kozakia baliensis TaxID=153496 RepID=UPI00068989C3|nr:peroxiredoxin-like family protein [Kozakia baliensis]
MVAADIAKDISNVALNARLEALNEERRRTWAPEALAVNVGQRQTLVHEHDKRAAPQVGDMFPDITLNTTTGDRISLSNVVAQRGAVLIFFRFAGCPACNIALPYYRDALYPALRDAGIPLLAISPQPSALLHEIVERHNLPFTVASDTELSLARRLGITYQYDDASRAAAQAKDTRPENLNGTSSWELPKPSVFVLSPELEVVFADVSPDWMVRTEAEAILSAIKTRPQKTKQEEHVA